ncbi:hypothetical protein HDU77_000288, partial [Chytriomyces hyalinus]
MWSGFEKVPLQRGDKVSLCSAERKKVDRRVTAWLNDGTSSVLQTYCDSDSDDEGNEENVEVEWETTTPVPKKVKTGPYVLLSVVCLNEGGIKTTQLGAAALYFQLEKKGISIFNIIQDITKQAPPPWLPLTVKLGYKTSKTGQVFEIVSEDNLSLVLNLLQKGSKVFSFICYANQKDVPTPSSAPRGLRSATKELTQPVKSRPTGVEQELRMLYVKTCTVDENHMNGCYRHGERHLLLSGHHFRQWASTIENGVDLACTVSTPPSLVAFDMSQAKKLIASLQQALSSPPAGTVLNGPLPPSPAHVVQTATCTFITLKGKAVLVLDNRVVLSQTTVASLLSS